MPAPSTPQSDDALATEQSTPLRTKNIPPGSALLHLKRPGTLHRAQAAPFWAVNQFVAEVADSSGHRPANMLATRLQYVGCNRPATMLEFGFLKVDEVAREALCRHVTALNQLMRQTGTIQVAFSTARSAPCWPQFFFHENHFPTDFKGGHCSTDYAHFHGAGLIHKDGVQLTHYHFQLGWKTRDVDGAVVICHQTFLPDHRSVRHAASRYFRLFLQSLDLPTASIGDSGASDGQSVIRPGAMSTGDVTMNQFAMLLAALPVAPTRTHYYDALAEQGLTADPDYPITMNLERTPREIYAAARQRLSHADDDAGEPAARQVKRRPGFKEFSTLFYQLKNGTVDVSEIDRDANVMEAMAILRNALKL